LFKVSFKSSSWSVALAEERRDVKMAENKDTAMSFAIGFLVGAAIGVTVGFLYAPRPGKETRAMIKQKAEEVKEKVGEVAEKAKEAATEARAKVQEKLGMRKAATE